MKFKLGIFVAVLFEIVLSIGCFFGTYYAFKRGLSAWATNGTYIPVLTNLGPELTRVIAFVMLVIALFIMYKFGTKGFIGGVIILVGSIVCVFFGPKYGFVAGALGLIGSFLILKNLFKKDHKEEERKQKEAEEKAAQEAEQRKQAEAANQQAQPVDKNVEQEVVEQPNDYSDLVPDPSNPAEAESLENQTQNRVENL